MPYKDPDRAREEARKGMQRLRDRRKAEKEKAAEPPPIPDPPADPAAAVAEWSRERLVVPPGHPLAGQPMELPDFGVRWLQDALAPEVRESALVVARKNGKSAVTAVLVLALLTGPLRRQALRIATASVTRDKAGELLRQCREIGEASGLEHIEFRLSPRPGWITTPIGASAEFLSADKMSGHASGFDYAIVDEAGLLTERDRDLVNGLRTSTSARDGRFLALSIRGDSPMLEEMIERGEVLDTCRVHMYAPPEPEDGQPLDISDPEVWSQGNPGIACGIKSAAWMRDEAARVEITPSDRASFMALDLNMKGSPTREMLVSLEDYRAMLADDLPPRAGPVVLGADLGGATSGTAAVAIWTDTGRVESWLAFGDNPSLVERGNRDGARYDMMAERGELQTYPGRVTPVKEFIQDVVSALEGEDVQKMAADDYKAGELRDALDAARTSWPLEIRRMGAGKQGFHDVRAAQRAVIGGKLKMRPSLAFLTALRSTVIRREQTSGNPVLERSTGRIDLISAFVLAAGLLESRKPVVQRKASDYLVPDIAMQKDPERPFPITRPLVRR